MSEVIKFPSAPMEKNVTRHFSALFARMSEMGLTPEQQNELLLQTFKDMGAVEIDGVWQIPGTLPEGWKWPADNGEGNAR